MQDHRPAHPAAAHVSQLSQHHFLQGVLGQLCKEVCCAPLSLHSLDAFVEECLQRVIDTRHGTPQPELTLVRKEVAGEL